MTQIAILIMLLALALVVLAGSILYRISEVRADAAASDALIARVRRGGGYVDE